MALKKNSKVEEFEQLTEQLDEEERRKLDPDLPLTDEDGIVRDVPLLAGYIDPQTGILHDTFSYREMNGKDEEAISKADVRSNSAKLANVLCERCVVAIGTLTKKELGNKWGDVIRSMLGGDIDYMMFKIRELSKGKEVTFTHKCPNCGQKLTTIVSTDEFGIREFKGSREVPFTLIRGYKNNKGAVCKEGTFRLPTGRDREIVVPVIKKNPSTAATILMTRGVTFNDGTIPLQEQIAKLTLRDRAVLEDIMKEHAFGIDTTIEDLMCDSCGQDISGELGQSDFF